MKSRILYALSALVIIASTLVASSKLIETSFYTSHDGEGHVIRMIEYDEALHDGQLPVRMTKRINFGLGYPFFNFNYPAPYAIGQFFHEIGFSFVDSFKLLMFVGTLLGGLGMFLFMKTHVGIGPALMAAFFYIFVPYRFLNMYVRGNPAENFALGLLPILFWTVDRLIKTSGRKSLLFILIGSIFVLSHNTTVLMITPLIALYFLLTLPKKKEERIQIFRSLVLGLLMICLLTSFFWLPVVIESRLTKLVELGEDYIQYFPSLREVVYSPWGFGQYIQGIYPGKMSPQMGLIHVGILGTACIFACLLLVQKRKERHILLWFFLGAAFLALFLMLPVSQFLWHNLFLLRFIQIPWRFLGIISFSAAFLAGYLVQNISVPKIIKYGGCVLLVMLLVYANRNHIRVNQDIVFTNPFEKNLIYGPSTTSKDEHMPRMAPRIYDAPDPNGTLIDAEGGSSVRTLWTTNMHVFEVEMKNQGEFRDNTSYFPGWVATIDGKNTEILYNRDEYQRLRIAIPEGSHRVTFEFKEPWYRMLVDIVSLTALTGFGVWILVKKGKGI